MAAPVVITQLPPFRAAQRGQEGYFSIAGHIDTPGNQDYGLLIYVPVVVNIVAATYKLSAGTITMNIKIGSTVGTGTSITGLSALACTATIASTTFSATDGTANAQVAQCIFMTLSANAGSANLDFAITLQRGSIVGQ